jgi:hypothetical protein
VSALPIQSVLIDREKIDQNITSLVESMTTNEVLANHPKINVRKMNKKYQNNDHYRFDQGDWNLGKKKVDMKFTHR